MMRIALHLLVFLALVAISAKYARASDTDFPTSLAAAHEAAVQRAWDSFAAALDAAKTSDRETAIQKLEDGLDVVPHDLRMQVLLATLLELEGHPADALKRWKYVARTTRDREDKASADEAVARLRGAEATPAKPRRTHSWTFNPQADGLTAKAAIAWCKRAMDEGMRSINKAGLETYGVSGCNCNPDRANAELARCSILFTARARDPL